jgi:hypothetical protein
MKKLLILLTVILSGCSTCLMSQPPTQFIYVGPECSAPLPDYTGKIIVTDNCGISNINQVPAAGFILNYTTQQTTVTITATDVFNNKTAINFLVKLIDTVPPVITYADLMTHLDKVNDLYDIADLNLLSYIEMGNKSMDSLGLSYGDSTYYYRGLVTFTAPGRAVLNQGGRAWTFMDNDTLILREY